MQPRFSVIIPAFNRAYIIATTLRSVVAQDFENYECIIVDDGSSDVEELEEAVAMICDSRFRVVRRENGGGGAARNTGIDEATGEYIAFLDSDDLFLPDKLSTANEKLLGACTSSTDVLFSQVIVNRGLDKSWIKPSRAPKRGERIDEYLITNQGFIQTSTIVVDRLIAKSVRFDESLPFGQDTDFCIRLAASGCTFTMLDAPLVIWRDDSAANRVSSNRRHESILEWTDRNRLIMTTRSYHAYRGWHGAKAAIGKSRLKASALYFTALFRGAFGPSLALRAAIQIYLPPQLYRRIANLVVGPFGRSH